MTFIPGGGSSSGGGNVFIYQQGGVAAGNVFTSWATAFAARAAVTGPAVIVIDDSLGACNLSAGTFDMSETDLVGILWNVSSSHFAGIAELSNSGGGILTNLRRVKDLSLSGVTIHFAPFGDEFSESVVFDNVQYFSGAVACTSTCDVLYITLLNGTVINSGIVSMSNVAESNVTATGAGSQGPTTVVSGAITATAGTSIQASVDDVARFDEVQTLSGGSTLSFKLLSQFEINNINADLVLTNANPSSTTVNVTGLTANHQATLPVTAPVGQEFTFIDGDGTMGSFTYTLVGTINGIANYVMSGALSTATVKMTSTGWRLV